MYESIKYLLTVLMRDLQRNIFSIVGAILKLVAFIVNSILFYKLFNMLFYSLGPQEYSFIDWVASPVCGITAAIVADIYIGFRVIRPAMRYAQRVCEEARGLKDQANREKGLE